MSNTSISGIHLCKDGVYIEDKQGNREWIADLIRVVAFGESDPRTVREEAYTLIKFLDRYGKRKLQALPSSMLTAQPGEFVALLSRLGYQWPPTSALRTKIIDELSTARPRRRIRVALVPGWHDSSFVLPGESYTPEGPDRKRFKLCACTAVGLGQFQRRGELADWQKFVGLSGTYSSRARLAIASVFAAPNLRPLNVSSFGFNFSGPSSGGKSLLIRYATSAAGLLSSEGPATWDGSPAGLEQRALGHRDCIAPLDDVSHLGGDASKITKLITFRLASNRPKTRAGQYVRAHNLVDTDCRVISLSTSEDPLWEGIDRAKRRHVRGEEVRMINIRACMSDKGDIFDGPNVDERIGVALDDRVRFVEQQEMSTLSYQGEPLRAYLAKRVSDPNTDQTLKSYMDEYLVKVPLTEETRPLARIRRFFAVVYASAAQAIDYGILPWSKKPMLDIANCMKDAMDQLVVDLPGSPRDTSLPTDNLLIGEFKDRMKNATFARLNRCSAEELKKADGLIRPNGAGKIEVFLYSKTLKAWVPDMKIRKRLTALLRFQRLMKKGRRPDTSTRQVHVARLGKKIPCYAILRKRICS